MGQINVNPQKIMRTFGVKPGTLCLVTVISRGDKFRLGRPPKWGKSLENRAH